MSEAVLMKRIMLALSSEGAKVFRNSVGAFQDKRGKWIHFGLCDGSSDLIGWTNDGRFLAVEVKMPGAYTKPARLLSQQRFIAAVNAGGGVGFFASSVEEAVAKLKGDPWDR